MLPPSGRKGKAAGPPDWARELPPGTLVLMDGFGYIFRAYFSRVDFMTRSGIPTGAVTVFGNMLLSVLKELSPAAMAVVFESRTGNIRSEILPDIKANRPEPPPGLPATDSLYRTTDPGAGYSSPVDGRL